MRILTRNKKNLKNPSELKSTITEMKDTLEGINTLHDTEESASDLEERIK